MWILLIAVSRLMCLGIDPGPDEHRKRVQRISLSEVLPNVRRSVTLCVERCPKCVENVVKKRAHRAAVNWGDSRCSRRSPESPVQFVQWFERFQVRICSASRARRLYRIDAIDEREQVPSQRRETDSAVLSRVRLEKKRTPKSIRSSLEVKFHQRRTESSVNLNTRDVSGSPAEEPDTNRRPGPVREPANPSSAYRHREQTLACN